MTQPIKDFGEFDYVITGGGTAGCVLANRLSADPQVTVLLLEAGGKDGSIWIHIPIGYLYCINSPRTDWCYRTEPEAGLNGRSIIYARGRARDYDQWAQITGDSRWNSSKAFLRPIQQRQNLKVVTGALIDKLILEGREARGVEFRLNNTTHRVTARIETLLTARPPAAGARP